MNKYKNFIQNDCELEGEKKLGMSFWVVSQKLSLLQSKLKLHRDQNI